MNFHLEKTFPQILTHPEVIDTLKTLPLPKDTHFQNTVDTFLNKHPEVHKPIEVICAHTNLIVAINDLLAVTTINEQEDSEATQLLKQAGSAVAKAAQAAQDLSVDDTLKLIKYVYETKELIIDPNRNLNSHYYDYINEAIGMNRSNAKWIALSMLTFASVILLLASITLGVGLAVVTMGASIPFSAIIIAALGGVVTAGVTAAVGGVAGLSFATVGGIFAERARKGELHLAMDDFASTRTKVCGKK